MFPSVKHSVKHFIILILDFVNKIGNLRLKWPGVKKPLAKPLATSSPVTVRLPARWPGVPGVPGVYFIFIVFIVLYIFLILWPQAKRKVAKEK